ncbi:DJ-1/PfpI family protein [Kallotenue papyrolyticum]|uniref:DJ-1/PfpI family protein n=1 Tax=Kallotenue papyrolyticum TaxID=1325125 RepID=UPI0004785397|nr:DJ-1/PfpI family protein [Kallotenue papyrolyticum]
MLWFGRSKRRLARARVAILITDGVEQAQLDAVIKRLRAHGAQVFLIGVRPGKVQAMRALRPSTKIAVDITLDEVHPASFQALVIPGGSLQVDRLRRDPGVLQFVREFDRAGQPIAVIGHAALVLASAGLLAGRRLTGWPGIRDDVVNAGGVWVDAPYVVDDNLLSGRATRDAHAWSKQVAKHIARRAEVVEV